MCTNYTFNSLVPRLYFFLFLSSFLKHVEALNYLGGTKEGNDVRERKSKAWYAKSRDPHTFL